MNDIILNAFLLTGIITIALLVIFICKKHIFLVNYKSILQKIETFNDSQQKKKSVLLESIEYLVIFFFIGVFTIFLLWVQYHTSPIVVYLLCIVSLVLFITMHFESFKKDIKGAMIFLLMVLPLFVLFLFNEQYSGAIVLNGLILGIGFSLKWDKYKKQLRNKIPSFRIKSTKYKELIIAINDIASKLSESKRFKREILNTQALVISLSIIIFVLFPRISFLFTENIITKINNFIEYVLTHKDEIPFYVFFAYILLSITLTIDFINSFYTNENKRFINRLYNLLVFFIMIAMMIPYTLIAFLIFAIVVGVGYSIFGIDFAIILGFFVFPNWIAKLHSYQIAIFVLAFPSIKIFHKSL